MVFPAATEGDSLKYLVLRGKGAPSTCPPPILVVIPTLSGLGGDTVGGVGARLWTNLCPKPWEESLFSLGNLYLFKNVASLRQINNL